MPDNKKKIQRKYYNEANKAAKKGMKAENKAAKKAPKVIKKATKAAVKKVTNKLAGKDVGVKDRWGKGSFERNYTLGRSPARALDKVKKKVTKKK